MLSRCLDWYRVENWTCVSVSTSTSTITARLTSSATWQVYAAKGFGVQATCCTCIRILKMRFCIVVYYSISRILYSLGHTVWCMAGALCWKPAGCCGWPEAAGCCPEAADCCPEAVGCWRLRTRFMVSWGRKTKQIIDYQSKWFYFILFHFIFDDVTEGTKMETIGTWRDIL